MTTRLEVATTLMAGVFAADRDYEPTNKNIEWIFDLAEDLIEEDRRRDRAYGGGRRPMKDDEYLR